MGKTIKRYSGSDDFRTIKKIKPKKEKFRFETYEEYDDEEEYEAYLFDLKYGDYPDEDYIN